MLMSEPRWRASKLACTSCAVVGRCTREASRRKLPCRAVDLRKLPSPAIEGLDAVRGSVCCCCGGGFVRASTVASERRRPRADPPFIRVTLARVIASSTAARCRSLTAVGTWPGRLFLFRGRTVDAPKSLRAGTGPRLGLVGGAPPPACRRAPLPRPPPHPTGCGGRQVFELDDHPYYLGCQFHPEFKSKPTKPSPLFLGLLHAAAGSPSM